MYVQVALSSAREDAAASSLVFFVKERQPLRCNVQPESQNTCFPHNIIKNETGNIERRMHITQNYHKKNILQ